MLITITNPASFWPPPVMPNSAACFYGVGGVITTIGKPDHLRFRSLRLQQEAREIGSGERVQRLANHLATARGDDIPQVLRQLASERVVGHQQEPSFSTLCQHRLGGARWPASKCRTPSENQWASIPRWSASWSRDPSTA
jgi:hypothetical protein